MNSYKMNVRMEKGEDWEERDQNSSGEVSFKMMMVLICDCEI